MCKKHVVLSALIALMLMLSAAEAALADTQHIVKIGDDLWSIASQYGVTVDELKTWNDLSSGELQEGQALIIQVSGAEAANAIAVAVVQSTETVYYTVQEGETLETLSKDYQTTAEQIMLDNELFSEDMQVGQVLKLQVPSDIANVVRELEADRTAERAAEQLRQSARMTSIQSSNAAYGQYCVQAGDTLAKIARECGTSIEDLQQANNLDSDLIFAGQLLNISGMNVSGMNVSGMMDNGINGINDEEFAVSRGSFFREFTEAATVEGQTLVDFACNFLDTPYVYGGTSPAGFDCSGFVQYVYRNALNISLKRTAAEQATQGVEVSKGDWQAGDIIYFSYGGYIGHVGLYIGNGQFIHSSSPTTGGVIISSLGDSYYSSRYAGARRIL